MYRYLLVAALAFSLAGCGLKGNLEFPQEVETSAKG